MRNILLTGAAALGLLAVATPANAAACDTQNCRPKTQAPVAVVTPKAPEPVVVERVVVREVQVPAPVAVAATPANARFVGVRADVNAGVTDFRGERKLIVAGKPVIQRPDAENFTYGVTVGADAPIGSRVTLGADLDLQRPFDGDRQLGAGARLGLAVTDRALVFGRVGYAKVDLNDDSLELRGLTYGGGAEFALGRRTYLTTEYRYTDFNHRMGSHGGRVGLGIRF